MWLKRQKLSSLPLKGETKSHIHQFAQHSFLYYYFFSIYLPNTCRWNLNPQGSSSWGSQLILSKISVYFQIGLGLIGLGFKIYEILSLAQSTCPYWKPIHHLWIQWNSYIGTCSKHHINSIRKWPCLNSHVVSCASTAP